jgi:hypothetical protein
VIAVVALVVAGIYIRHYKQRLQHAVIEGPDP